MFTHTHTHTHTYIYIYACILYSVYLSNGISPITDYLIPNLCLYKKCSMHVCIYIYICVCVCACIHACVCIHNHPIQTHLRKCIFKHIDVYTHIRLSINALSVYIYIYIYIYLYGTSQQYLSTVSSFYFSS